MTDAEGLLALYELKSRAELADADAVVGAGPGAWRGAAIASVALVVGPPGDASGSPLGGEAGEAVAKALAALGFAAGSEFVIATRPSRDADGEAFARRLRLALEAVDPTLVLALDAAGAGDLRGAYGLTDMPVGEPIRVMGRTLGYVGDFVASLSDVSTKARVWSAMKAIARSDASAAPTKRLTAPRQGSEVRDDRPRT